MTADATPDRRSGKPLAAIASQGIVAASSLLLQLVALDRLGEEGLGRFALLFGILITANSVQSGWLGDSLTVLDRFDPGVRRALFRSQLAIVVLVGLVTTLFALPVGGIDTTTALLFGLASVAWVLEETLRRLLIARREFTKLVVNDASFAVGSFGFVGFSIAAGATFELRTLVVALLVGALVAIALGLVQLPRSEIIPGDLGPSRMREVASFAIWRAAQIGLRPGSQALVRTIIVAAASYEALGQLEAARLLLAPVLTVVNGAGVYLLPTYSAQVKQGRRFQPHVPVAMAVVGGAAAVYGAIAIIARAPLSDLLGSSSTTSVLALLSWTAFSVGFGAGVPAGNALVARNQSRTAFNARIVDAVVGISVASAFAVGGTVDAVPFGLAAGTAVGAALLLRALRSPAPPTKPSTGSTPPSVNDEDADRLDSLTFTPSPTRLKHETVPSVPQPQLGPLPATPAGRAVRFPLGRGLWLAPLIAIVATEYKVRRRDIDDALGGSLDLVIMAELAIYGLIGLWAFWRLAPTSPRLTSLTVIMWGYILTTAASALYSTFAMLALARGVQLLILGAVVHALATEGRVSHIARLIHAWIILITISIGVGLVYVAPVSAPQVGRFTWLSVHSVSAGSMLALSAPMLLGLWLAAGRRDNPTPPPWPQWTYGALLIVHLVFLLATRTRGSIGGCFVALAVMAWIWSGQRAKPQLALGSLLVGGSALLALGGPVMSFLTRGESAEQIGTFNRRTEIWTLAWEAFVDRPLHGLGFASAKGVFFDETGLGGAHNALINVMIDVGLAGLIWWVLLIGAVGFGISRIGSEGARRGALPGATGSSRSDHVVLIGLLVASLINSVTTEGLGAGVNVSAIWLYLMAGWICILRRESRRFINEVSPQDLDRRPLLPPLTTDARSH